MAKEKVQARVDGEWFTLETEDLPSRALVEALTAPAGRTISARDTVEDWLRSYGDWLPADHGATVRRDARRGALGSDFELRPRLALPSARAG
jgi:hypothetical protein